MHNLERNTEIIRRRVAGAWPNEIRRALGISRNVVAGVLNRARMNDPEVDRAVTAPRGARNGGAKLSEAEVIAIRASPAASGVTALARRYGVSVYTIYDVVGRRTWKHVA